MPRQFVLPTPESLQPPPTLRVVAGALAASPKADSETVQKRERLLGILDEVNNQLLNTLSVECKSCSHAHQLSSYNDLPKKIMGDLNQCLLLRAWTFIQFSKHCSLW